VKSYAYAGRVLDKGNLISKIKGLPTTVKWSYDTNTMRCNVAYDVFTAADPNHVNSSGDYELMIWYVQFTFNVLFDKAHFQPGSVATEEFGLSPKPALRLHPS
jgi:hypothetical protein